MDAEPVIHVRGLRKRFGRTEALAGVDLDLPRGSVTGLLGANGAGKSTLIGCLVGQLRRDAGAARVLGHDPWDLPEDAKARIGYVAQRPALQPWLTAGHHLDYVAAWYERWDADLVARLCARWEVDRRALISRLSPGQAQRVALIGALGHHPELLVLDEPAAALDPVARRELLGVIIEAVAADGCSVLLSTHLASDVERVADRVAIVRKGRTVYDGELGALKESMRRIRLSGAALPERLERPWLVAYERRPGGASAVVRGDVSAATAELRALGAEVAADELGLEDILVELHR